ncbi:HAMP domain-containing protein, partial [Ensifer sp. LCM 4579]|uniref:HAMP domain-containing protein n=1 Tax=Ensifer sp. LCM 4579 TaxID=1848292 RepID=UPI000E2EAEED
MLSNIFSRIGTKLALMSGAGILAMVIITVASWYLEQEVNGAITRGRVQADIARSLIDAKASMRGMQIATRDLRLAETSGEVTAARTYLQERFASVQKYLDEALAQLAIPANQDRVKAIKSQAEAYFGTGQELAKVIEAKLGTASADASLEAKEKELRFSLDSTAEVMTKTVDVGVETAKANTATATEERRQIQSTASMFNNAMALVMVLLLIGSAIFGARSIARPIGRLTGSMSVLAEGNLEADIPFTERRDEIGEMARAVEVFKQNGIKVRELNAQEAALQAKSADLQSNIGEVVQAAVAGDFTRRISKDYDNADLNRFAAQVNELVTSVDRGIAETRRVISALAEGDLTETMRGEFQGAFGELQQNV